MVLDCVDLEVEAERAARLLVLNVALEPFRGLDAGAVAGADVSAEKAGDGHVLGVDTLAGGNPSAGWLRGWSCARGRAAGAGHEDQRGE